MNELAETAENLRTIERYAVAAAATVRERVSGLSPRRQKTHKRLTFGQKTALVLSTVAFLVTIGCSTNPLNLDQQLKPAVAVEQIVTSTLVLPDKQEYRESLPKDIIPEEELEKEYHTRIYNTPDIKLHLRRAVLEEEPIFKWLKTPTIIGDQEFPKTLNIILVNGPIVHPYFLTPEQRKIINEVDYKPLTSAELEIEKEKRRYEIVERRAEYSSKLDEDLEQGKITKEDYEQIKLYMKYSLETSLSHVDDLIEEDLIIDNLPDDPHIGMYKKLSPSNLNILIAVRSSTSLRDTFPDPSDFPVDMSHKYPVERATVGHTLRHEFAHFQQGRDETATDLYALETIKKAHEALLRGDDSLYYFVLETPEGNVVTENKTTENQKT